MISCGGTHAVEHLDKGMGLAVGLVAYSRNERQGKLVAVIDDLAVIAFKVVAGLVCALKPGRSPYVA